MIKMDVNQKYEKVLEANSDFYNAFENLSIERMEGVWTHDENTVCVHPGWDLFVGWSQQTVKLGVTATNIFEYSNGKEDWLIVHHHGSSVSNYLSPNLSVQ